MTLELNDRIRLHGNYPYNELLRDLRDLIRTLNETAVSQEEFDDHDHDSRYYTKAEIDAIIASL